MHPAIGRRVLQEPEDPLPLDRREPREGRRRADHRAQRPVGGEGDQVRHEAAQALRQPRLRRRAQHLVHDRHLRLDRRHLAPIRREVERRFGHPRPRDHHRRRPHRSRRDRRSQRGVRAQPPALRLLQLVRILLAPPPPGLIARQAQSLRDEPIDLVRQHDLADPELRRLFQRPRRLLGDPVHEGRGNGILVVLDLALDVLLVLLSKGARGESRHRGGAGWVLRCKLGLFAGATRPDFTIDA